MKIKVKKASDNMWYKGLEGMQFYVFFVAQFNAFFLNQNLFFLPEDIVTVTEGEALAGAFEVGYA